MTYFIPFWEYSKNENSPSGNGGIDRLRRGPRFDLQCYPSFHIVINVSAPHYNLGAAKIVNWLRAQGQGVAFFNGDPGLAMPSNVERVWLSLIFSWHAPLAAQIALRMKPRAEVFCGGPGMFALGKWWKQETGLVAHRGLDARFERQRGDYEMTFASRGCPVNCSFCLVPRLEGTEFTLDWDFDPAPILCDNNLSALPVDFQDHILAAYRRSGIALRDCNSGFEPRTFDEATFARLHHDFGLM